VPPATTLNTGRAFPGRPCTPVERLAALNEASASAGGRSAAGTIDFVRIGAPERMSNAALGSSLDARVVRETRGFFGEDRSVRRRQIIDATRRGRSTQEQMQRGRGARGRGRSAQGRERDGDAGLHDGTDRDEDIAAYLATLRREQRSLTKSGRKAKAAAERSILSRADVVLATSVGAGAENIQKLPAFDLAVLDEVRIGGRSLGLEPGLGAGVVGLCASLAIFPSSPTVESAPRRLVTMLSANDSRCSYRMRMKRSSL
jgi:hypothetical protein